MAEVEAKRPLVKDVEEKASEKRCLICGETAKGSRGLCVAHYLQFYRSLTELPKRDRASFEAEQIREGRILASGQIAKIKRPSPFKSEKESA